MKHLDLFSGIGGFAYAAQQVWGDEYENIGFCDNDWFCQQVLAKNFPGATIHADIRALTNTYSKRSSVAGSSRNRRAGFENSVDLVTGGFPCQPFSQAGKRRGTDDNRYLWPEMLRVIREFQPAWVIGENVGGLVTWNKGMVLEQVCTDLEAAGYEVQPFLVPAAAVNAPHRRDRVWIVAHAKDRSAGRLGLERQPDEKAAEPGNEDIHAADTERQGRRAGIERKLQSQKRSPERAQRSDPDWSRDWQEVAFATCLPRMDDGLSKRVVRLPDGTTISEARWRKEAIKAYGNAIVPQVAMEIMKVLKEINNAHPLPKPKIQQKALS